MDTKALPMPHTKTEENGGTPFIAPEDTGSISSDQAGIGPKAPLMSVSDTRTSTPTSRPHLADLKDSISSPHTLAGGQDPLAITPDALPNDVRFQGAGARFKVQNRPAQLIRNLHANYFNQSPGISHANSSNSAVATAIRTIRANVFGFGAVVSVVGCAFLLGQDRDAGQWPKALAQVAYRGIFAAVCSWQFWKTLYPVGESISIQDDSPKHALKPPKPMDDQGTPSPAQGNGAVAEHLSSSELTPESLSKKSWASSHVFAYCVFGYGVLGLLGHGLLSLDWNPHLVLVGLVPWIMAPTLIVLDAISDALVKDQHRHAAKVEELHEHHDTIMEAYRDDNILKKNILLETVGKEVQDAATLAIETLCQMTPASLFPQSISREQLSPCTLPIPITSVLSLFTTMRHLQYISRNMQRLSRVMFTEYVQGIVEKTSPHYHRGENGFDVGEFVQSLGDLVSADASLKGVEFVIYHSEYDLNHVPIKGSEESWRHALINLIKSIIDSAKPGSTVELCLVLFTVPQPEKQRNKVMVSFEITYLPNPDSTSADDDLAQLNALLASKLVKAMGGTLVIEQLEKRSKKFIVSVEVEMGGTSQDERTGNLRHLEHHPRPVHPLEPTKIDDGAVDHLQRMENMQTAHPMRDSQQFLQHHIKTPLVSPSPTPSSPPPKRAGAQAPKISSEPTITELVRFSRKLTGLKVVLWSREHSAFAHRLTGYLKTWGINVLKRTIQEEGVSSESENGELYSAEDPPTPTSAKRTNSSSSLSGKLTGKTEGASPGVKALSAPAFVMIDDDVKVLAQQILKLQSTPSSPAPAGQPRRPSHRRHKSVSSIQHTSIIYFTSLPTFKQAKDTITFILGTQASGMNFQIINTLSGQSLQQSNLPYILVLPKPAGPRRVLTAIHTAINVPVLDHTYSPIATAPTSPAPMLRHFSDEINPLDRDQIVYDPVSNQAFARHVPHSTQSSPGGLSPNSNLGQEQRQSRDMVRQLIDAGRNVGPISYPFEQASLEFMSPETPGSSHTFGSPTGVHVPATGRQPPGIEFDPTARGTGALSPSLTGPNVRRISNGSGRASAHSTSSSESLVLVQPANGSIQRQPFQLKPHRLAEVGPTTAGMIRLSSGQLLQPGGGRSPLGTPPAIMQAHGVLHFSPPTVRHSAMSSPLPQRPEPAATRQGTATGTMNSGLHMSTEGSKGAHPVLPRGSLPHGPMATSPLPTSPGSTARISPGMPNVIANPTSSPSPHVTPNARPRGIQQAKKGKDTKGARTTVKSGVVERVSPLVNVLIVEDNYINQKILAKFMAQRNIKHDLACNGKEAVDKWKTGGYHLVLMDLQMPVMDGIAATKEIRRLERAQKIGVFPTDKPSSSSSLQLDAAGTSDTTTPSSLTASSTETSTAPSTPPSSPFRSPVIIVALTAAAESEDARNTALVAGCNDYITKPIDFSWLEGKIVDWGCMQALIDVDAWKKWKKDLEGRSPGSPGTLMLPQPSPAKKSLASGVSRATIKRPSISSRSIKNVKSSRANLASSTATTITPSSSTKAPSPHSSVPSLTAAASVPVGDAVVPNTTQLTLSLTDTSANTTTGATSTEGDPETAPRARDVDVAKNQLI